MLSARCLLSSLALALSAMLASMLSSPVNANDGIEDCSDLDTRPLPRPGTPGASEFWAEFSRPLDQRPVWNPPGKKRVGLQAGHWRVEEAPGELRGLSTGTYGGGKAEWEVNLDVAERAATMLRDVGVEVDVLPVQLPPRYRAHALIALHADGDTSGALNGFKVARAVFSAVPETDERLVATLNDAYQAVTGMPRDDWHISRRMTGYYAFNSRRYCHAIAPGVPAAIVEMGFLTNAGDRLLLLGNPDLLARGVADGILRFLDSR
jgi:N-acetylmuramoyl-L-alanine amidase